MIYTVDRLEGGLALLEGPEGEVKPVPVNQLPQGLHEGAKLEGGQSGWVLRPDLEEEARRALQARLARLKGKPGR